MGLERIYVLLPMKLPLLRVLQMDWLDMEVITVGSNTFGGHYGFVIPVPF